jgi:hypothetical protein
VDAELKTMWIRDFHVLHRNLLERCQPGLGSNPAFKVEFVLYEGESNWGYYNEESRTIGINQFLLENCPWETVDGIMGHETAHQLVAHFHPLAYLNEGAHGPTFKAICRKLWLSPIFAKASSDVATALDPPNPYRRQADLATHPILEKVRKLLALASSPEPAEAEAALAAASRIMAKHNLILAQEDGYAADEGFERWLFPLGTSRLSAKVSWIGTILEEHFFVKVIMTYHFDHFTNQQDRALEMIGRPVNLIMAEHVFHFLMERCETLWAYEKPKAQRMGETGLGAKTAFIVSLLRNFREKLQKSEKQAQSSEGLKSSALILRGDAALGRFIDLNFPRLIKIHSQGGYQPNPYSRKAGATAGQELNIRPPIAKGQSEGGLKGYLE